MNFPTLKNKIEIKGIMTARTGIHVGGPDVGLGIGGADKLVVRDPGTHRPYIPGSSLKGKMRSLLEKAGQAKGFKIREKDKDDGGKKYEAKPCQCGQGDCLVCLVFGVPAEVTKTTQQNPETTPMAGAGRLFVRDCPLTEASAQEMTGWRSLTMPFTETKTEVSIDRLTSQANPRTFERVPAGAKFQFEMVLNLYQHDKEADLLNLVYMGIELTSHDAVGGQGSRGYGAVNFEIQSVRKMTLSLENQPESEKSTLITWKPLPVEISKYPRMG